MGRKVISMGDTVLCDLCNTSFDEDNKEEGGFAFMSKAVCPRCATDFLNSVKNNKEEKYIKSYCPKGVTFRNYVIHYLRGGGSGDMVVLTGDDALAALNQLDEAKRKQD